MRQTRMQPNIELIIFRRGPRLPTGMTSNEYLFWYSLPFVLAIVYLVYKFFRNRKRVMSWNDGRIPSDFGTTESHIAEIFIVFAASISKRGRVHIRTKEIWVNKYIKKHFPDAKCKVDESFDFAIWNSIDLDELAFWCSQKLNHQQKLQLFEFLTYLSLVDHELVDDERELLLYVLNRFNLSFEELSAEAQSAVKLEEKKVVEVSVSHRKRYFSALGLREDASAVEIKKMYRLLVKEVHPDRHPNATPEERRMFEARFQEIQEAYEYLTSN